MQILNRVIALCLFVSLCLAAQAQDIFSKLSPGQGMPKDFRMVSYPNVKPNQFELVLSEGKTVLKVDSNNSAGRANQHHAAMALEG